ncbi:hypothetical protein, partial [uncultured Arthrobacter sp.]|uniref:hypothetical protein n=1 Tax=uncultured Arthrobacter sp. TaxID=114050 RepID=UPI0025CDA138
MTADTTTACTCTDDDASYCDVHVSCDERCNALRNPRTSEQVLAAYPWRFHHETLRELVDDPDELREVRDGLTAKLLSADRDAV